MSAPSTVDSSDALSSLQAHLGTFDRETLHRGQAYFRSGRVGAVVRFDDQTVTAEVRGSRLYRVELRRPDTDWQNSCTCPVARDCKHVAALGAHWLGKLAAIKRAAPPVFRPAGTTVGTAWERGAFRTQWEPVLAKANGRPLTSDEGAFLTKLSQLFHNFQVSGRISSVDIGRLGLATNESRRAPYEAAYAGWLPEPPSDPLDLWHCIAYDIETSGLAVPPFMRSISDTSVVRDFLQNRQRGESIKRWNDRFDRLLATPSTPPPVLGGVVLPPGFELRLSLAPGKWSLETRTRSEAPWKPAPKALLDRITRDPAGGLTTLDASPAVFAFLAVCHEHHRRTYSFALNPGTQGSRELLHRLLSHRLARTLVVGFNGEPLVFSDAPLAWEIQRSANSAQDYEIALRLPDGQPFPPAALHLPGRPDLYLHGSIVYQGPPALDGASATAAIVPSEVIERPEVLRTLRQFRAKLPAEIEARFVTVPLHARITCALEVDASDNEILTLHLAASAKRPPIERSWLPGGWSGGSKPSAETAEPDRELYTFDFSNADEAAGRLDELGVAFDSHLQCWTRKVTKTFPDEFIEWREALPAGTEVIANGELASLLSAPVRARIEFAVDETAAHRDWFDLALALKPEDSTLTREEIALLLKARGKLVRLPGKGWRRLNVELDGPPAAALEAAGFDVATIGEAALSGERHRFHALQLAQTAVVDLLPESQAGALRSRVQELSRPQAPAIPEGLKADLRPYQREGFEFLAFLSINGLGGVLADDMGLGKTLQALTWLLWLAGRQPKGEPLRTLVVCPKSVVGNWDAETARFAPTLGVVRFTPGRTVKELSGHPGQPMIVVANYTQLRLNAEFFRKQAWHAVILDEAQFIKNPASKVAQLARELPGQHRLVLTGTPIENRLLDLWSLFAFALPGLLGSQAAFKRHYSQDNPLALARLRTRVRHFLLRRTKKQVAADLPPRTEEDIVIELEGEQDRLYQAELKRARAQLLRVETPRQLDKARFNILASLMRLRQICCHPALIDDAHRDAPSAKLEELLERVEELRDEGHQVLVFSQFVEMLHIIRDRMTAVGIEHLLLTGQTDNREEIIAQFQADRSKTVFLLSLKAAGFGLNLTAASYVILYDPWWNPAVEAQAIDRAHRIGQSAPVNAYRFIARGTVEEKIRALQRDKAALANAVVQEDSLASVLDLETLKHVLS
jgi:superfamily II DNA or RNA helicase